MNAYTATESVGEEKTKKDWCVANDGSVAGAVQKSEEEAYAEGIYLPKLRLDACGVQKEAGGVL